MVPSDAMSGERHYYLVLGECLGSSHYDAQSELPDKGRSIKVMCVCRTLSRENMHFIARFVT